MTLTLRMMIESSTTLSLCSASLQLGHGHQGAQVLFVRWCHGVRVECRLLRHVEHGSHVVAILSAKGGECEPLPELQTPPQPPHIPAQRRLQLVVCKVK